MISGSIRYLHFACPNCFEGSALSDSALVEGEKILLYLLTPVPNADTTSVASSANPSVFGQSITGRSPLVPQEAKIRKARSKSACDRSTIGRPYPLAQFNKVRNAVEDHPERQGGKRQQDENEISRLLPC